MGFLPQYFNKYERLARHEDDGPLLSGQDTPVGRRKSWITAAVLAALALALLVWIAVAGYVLFICICGVRAANYTAVKLRPQHPAATA
jgi:hypothetical protein